MAKAPTKKQTSKKSTEERAVVIKVTGGTLTGRQVKAVKKCIERTGSVQFGFKDISVTRLPKSIAPELTFND